MVIVRGLKAHEWDSGLQQFCGFHDPSTNRHKEIDPAVTVATMLINNCARLSLGSANAAQPATLSVSSRKSEFIVSSHI